MSLNKCKSSVSRGFTLVEVMVALIIFSIGLLGLAGLQANAISGNSQSYYRTQANFFAYDILDRMRANRDSALNGDYDIGLGSVPTATLCNGTGADCTALDVADADRREWKQSLRGLPMGDGSIARVTTGGVTQFVVTVTWDDSHSGTQDKTITMRAEL
jgi:type IV pilus assembly protein PilV